MHYYDFFSLSILGYDCNVLPGSMNGGKFEKGCSGAVWSNGEYSYSYCTNSAGRYPWWEACCKWQDEKCVPKDNGNIV